MNMEAVQAAFLCNRKGDVCIAFDDPAFVQAELILVDREEGGIYAILHESDHLLGRLSPTMRGAFLKRETALLTALKPDGTIFEMMAPVSVSQHKQGES